MPGQPGRMEPSASDVTRVLCTGGGLHPACLTWLQSISRRYAGGCASVSTRPPPSARYADACGICLLLLPHLNRSEEGGLFTAGYVYLCRLSDTLPLTATSTATVACRLAWLLDKALGMSANNVLEAVRPELVFRHFFLQRCHAGGGKVSGVDIFYRIVADSRAPAASKASLDMVRDYLLRVDCKPHAPACQSPAALKGTVEGYSCGVAATGQPALLGGANRPGSLNCESCWKFFRDEFLAKTRAAPKGGGGGKGHSGGRGRLVDPELVRQLFSA